MVHVIIVGVLATNHLGQPLKCLLNFGQNFGRNADGVNKPLRQMMDVSPVTNLFEIFRSD